MASSTDLVIAMQSAVRYLYRFVAPVLMFMGTIGSILNLIVFTQKTLRKNPCSIYFIAYNVVNLLQIYASLLSLTLYVGYSMDLSAYNLPFCHGRIYLTTLFNILSAFYLILASIDRVLITSPNALTRQRSTRRLAYICIFSGTVFWILFHSHALFLSKIIEIAPNYFLCYYQPGIYFDLVSYYAIIKEILALPLMIICGIWTVKNIRSIQRVGPVPSLPVTRTGIEGTWRSASSKDRQLISMLRLDITIYGFFSLVLVIFLIYQQITQDYIKTPERIEIEVAITNLCLFCIDIPLCTSCYTNLITSKTFRKEVKKVLPWKRFFCME